MDSMRHNRTHHETLARVSVVAGYRASAPTGVVLRKRGLMFVPRQRAAISCPQAESRPVRITQNEAPIRDAILISALTGSVESMAEVVAFVSGFPDDDVVAVLEHSFDRGLNTLCRLADLNATLDELLRAMVGYMWASRCELTDKSHAYVGLRLFERLCTSELRALDDLSDCAVSELMRFYDQVRQLHQAEQRSVYDHAA
jgi:hypothetical protein